MPEIYDKKHSLVKSWVYYARLACEINQYCLTQWISELPGELWNLLSET